MEYVTIYLPTNPNDNVLIQLRQKDGSFSKLGEYRSWSYCQKIAIQIAQERNIPYVCYQERTEWEPNSPESLYNQRTK